MKKIIFTLFTFVSITTFSQNNSEKALYSTISLTGGVNLPFGDFKNGEDLQGETNNGINVGLQFNYLVKEKLAVSFAVLYTNNGFEAMPILPTVVTTNNSISTTDWSSTNFMGGVTGILPINESFSLHGSILGGLTVTSSPEITVKYTRSNDDYEIVRGKGRTGSFGYQIKVGPSYWVSKKFEIALNLSYYGTTAKFEGVQNDTSVNNSITSTSKSNFEQTVNLGMISIGIRRKL